MFALLPLVLSLAPQLAGMLFGSKASDVTARVSGIVTDLTGAPVSTGDGGDQSASAISGDPVKLAAFQQKLSDLHIELQKEADAEADKARADLLAQIKLSNDDTASARAMAMGTTGLKSYGALIISAIVMLLFFLQQLGINQVIWIKLAGSGKAPEGDNQLLYAAVTLVLGFWLGSSNGSQLKNTNIAKMADDLQHSVPVTTAEKMLAS